MRDDIHVDAQCRIISHHQHGPIGKNLEEEWMVRRIYDKEIAALHLSFLCLVLLGCTAHAAPPPQPPVTCTTPIMVPIVTATDANEAPVSTDKVRTNPPICACTDSSVRLCQ